jgi:8-oxo-dGTP pyrophosphatase MutT (NUDIX family)
MVNKSKFLKIIKMIKEILQYFDLKNNKIKRYYELEKAIVDKKQEAQELAKAYNNYKNECEELIKGCVLEGKQITTLAPVAHVEERFNKYFKNYVNELGELKKSIEDDINQKNKILKNYPELKGEIEKAEKEAKEQKTHSKKKRKMKKVMDEFKNGNLKSSSGEEVTDPKQAVAIAYSEAKINKAEIDTAIVTLVKGYQAGLIPQEEFDIVKEELRFFVELEKAEKEEKEFVEKKDDKPYLSMSLKELVEEHEKLTKILVDGTDEEQKKEGEKQKKELETYIADKKKLEKAEESTIEKVIEVKEPKEQKKYADAIIHSSTDYRKILFLHRSKDSEFAPNTYCLPGGHQDINETPEEAVIREVLEETGLVVKECYEVAQVRKPEIHYFECIVNDWNETSGEIILTEKEHINWCWMNQEEWKLKPLIANLAENLEKINDNENYKSKVKILDSKKIEKAEVQSEIQIEPKPIQSEGEMDDIERIVQENNNK